MDLLNAYQKLLDTKKVSGPSARPWYQHRESPPTPNQFKAMYAIKKNLGLEFRGSTSSEASEFIGKHIAKAMKLYNERRAQDADDRKQNT